MKLQLVIVLTLIISLACSEDGRLSNESSSDRMSPTFVPSTTIIEVHDSIATGQPLDCFYANNHIKFDASLIGAHKYRWYKRDSNGLSSLLNNDSTITISSEGKYELIYEKSFENIGVVEHSIVLNLQFCETWVEIPRSFTPDGDGQFETWMPFFEGVANFYVAVSNSSNQTIFTSENENKVFDGSYNNTKLPNGTYKFYVSGTFHNGWLFERSGSFELVR